EPGREWRLEALVFRGNEAISTDELQKTMTTKARRWYEFWKFWRPLPAFEPLTFRADLEKLRQLHRNRGYYHARISHDVELPAEVDVRRDAAAVTYRVESGPPSVFGEVRVSGAETVGEAVVRREVAFEPGQPFKQSLLERTRSNLVALRLFRSIRITEDKG